MASTPRHHRDCAGSQAVEEFTGAEDKECYSSVSLGEGAIGIDSDYGSPRSQSQEERDESAL